MPKEAILATRVDVRLFAQALSVLHDKGWTPDKGRYQAAPFLRDVLYDVAGPKPWFFSTDEEATEFIAFIGFQIPEFMSRPWAELRDAWRDRRGATLGYTNYDRS